MTGAETDRNARLEALLEQANVNYSQRSEFRLQPALAVEFLTIALRRKRSVRSPAAYALTRFRAAVAEREAKLLDGEPLEAVTVTPELVARVRESWTLPAVAIAALEDALEQEADALAVASLGELDRGDQA